MMLIFMDNTTNNFRMTEKQISKQLRFSDSTNERYRDDIQMDSPYDRNDYKKRTPKQKQSNTKNENSKPITNKNSKPALKVVLFKIMNTRNVILSQ